MRPFLVLSILLVTLLAAPGVSAIISQPNPTLPLPPSASLDARPEVGPDVPGAFLVATVPAFEDESWSCTAGGRTRIIDVPTGWDRVIAEYRQRPDGDPWDRLFVVQVAGVEVLRGTTPRTDFTVTKEWTRYASLFPQGGTTSITVDTSAWDSCAFSQRAYLTLRFYQDPATLDPPASSITNLGPSSACGKGTRVFPVAFPTDAPTRATLEFFASNHGDEEAQFSGRYFAVKVDGTEVANITVFPYVYAIVGFYGGNDVQHPVMWWSAHRALDHAGIHLGPGEIPPYRIELDAEQAALLHGAKDVQVYSNVVRCLWITSASFLLYE